MLFILARKTHSALHPGATLRAGKTQRAASWRNITRGVLGNVLLEKARAEGDQAQRAADGAD